MELSETIRRMVWRLSERKGSGYLRSVLSSMGFVENFDPLPASTEGVTGKRGDVVLKDEVPE